MIEDLINKTDNFEIVRDQVAAILAQEVASQKVLAADAGEDPNLWDFSVYLERSDPWDVFRDEEAPRPILAVHYDGGTFDGNMSNISERQHQTGRYNIDVFAKGVSQAEGAGQAVGDQHALLEAQRGVRFVRNVLMSANYRYLELQGVVWKRWVASITRMELPPELRHAEPVGVFRVALEVEFNEFSPQFNLETLEDLIIDISRKEDGEVVLAANFDYS